MREGGGEGGKGEIVPTGLPELSKPPRALQNHRKTTLFHQQHSQTLMIPHVSIKTLQNLHKTEETKVFREAVLVKSVVFIKFLEAFKQKI